jgi:integrase
MADIDRLPTGRWQARWRDNTGRQCKRSFPTKTQARDFLKEVEADLLRGTYRDDRRTKIPFKVYAEEWRAAQIHRPSTAAMVEGHLRRHVYPTFGHRQLGSIRQHEIQRWVKALELELQPATIEVVYSFVASIFRSAILNRDLHETPCVKITLPEVTKKRVEPLATSQVEALMAATPERYKALVILGAGCGVRQGEAFGLTVDRIHFLRREVTIDRQLTHLTASGSRPGFGPPKTKSSYRTIPLPNVVCEALARHLEQYPAGPDGLVFTNEHGRPLTRRRFSEVWRPAARRAGLPDTVTFHDLRHYYASLLCHHNESVKVVQARLGHKDAAETMNTYMHLWPNSEDSTRAAVDTVLGTERKKARIVKRQARFMPEQ